MRRRRARPRRGLLLRQGVGVVLLRSPACLLADPAPATRMKTTLPTSATTTTPPAMAAIIAKLSGLFETSPVR